MGNQYIRKGPHIRQVRLGQHNSNPTTTFFPQDRRTRNRLGQPCGEQTKIDKFYMLPTIAEAE